MTPIITHLFLETNVLNQSWPELSQKVDNIIGIAQGLGISVEIPEPVLVELRRQCRERVKNELDTVKKTLEIWRVVMGTPVADVCPKFATLCRHATSTSRTC
jgi:hypothetical protein